MLRLINDRWNARGRIQFEHFSYNDTLANNEGFWIDYSTSGFFQLTNSSQSYEDGAHIQTIIIGYLLEGVVTCPGHKSLSI